MARIRVMIDNHMCMLRSVSHDLRTPLTRLRLKAERLAVKELRATSCFYDIGYIERLI